MSNGSRFTVGPGREFNYPADPISEGIIKNAGGRSQLSEEDRAKVKTKTVVEGDDCSDMPEVALKLYVSRGWVLEQGSKTEPVVVPEPEPVVVLDPVVMPEPVVVPVVVDPVVAVEGVQ